MSSDHDPSDTPPFGAREPQTEMVVPGRKSGGVRLRWLVVGVAILAALVGLFLVQLLFGPDPAPKAPMTAESAPPASDQPVEAPVGTSMDAPETGSGMAAADVSTDAAMPASGGEAEEEIVILEEPSGGIEDMVVMDADESAAPEAPNAPAAASPAKPAPVRTASKGGFAVQIMSVHDESNIAESWADMQKKFPGILGGKTLDIEEADLGERGIFYRLRAIGYPSEASADKACEELKAKGQDCLVVPNS